MEFDDELRSRKRRKRSFQEKQNETDDSDLNYEVEGCSSSQNEDSSSQNEESWKPVVFQPVYCTDLESICASYIKCGRSTKNNHNTEKLRKHLVHQRWRIEFKRDTIQRYRYLSPDGNNCYYSLNKVCYDLMDGKQRNESCKGGYSKHKNTNKNHAEFSNMDIGLLAPDGDDSFQNKCTEDSIDTTKLTDSEGLSCFHSLLFSTSAGINGRLSSSGSSSPSGKQTMFSDNVSRKVGLTEGNPKEAIQKYVDVIENGKRKKDKASIENAKKHLKKTGWNLWMKDKKMKKELVYTSPNGKNYISLYRACKGFLQDSQNESSEKSTRSTDSKSAKVCNKLVPQPSGEFSSNKQKRKMKTGAYTKQQRRSNSRFSSWSVDARKRPRLVEPATTERISKTVLSWLIDKGVILPQQKITYIRKTDGCPIKHGRVTHDGFKCSCCHKVFSLVNFEAHAGCSTSQPAASIIFRGGKSLLEYQLQEALAKPEYVRRVRLKRNCSQYEGDSECSVCFDGGELLLCDHCPSAFHPDCVGLEGVPEGNWYCASCRCCICGLSEFNCGTNLFTDKSILYCDQCELGYHVGCLNEKESSQLNSCPIGSWVCSKSCTKMLGKSNPTSVEGLSWTILRSNKENGADNFDDETITEYHSKLHIALDVLHECFEPLNDPRTQSDVLTDIIFNRGSELRRLNFQGIYTIILEKGDELISVATFRVYGENVAEMPFIGTRFQFRHQGMCRLLVGELEKLLSALGVKKLVLPAVSELLNTWTGSFGFAQMTKSDRMELLRYNLLGFQDARMCQKFLSTPSTTTKDPEKKLIKVSSHMKSIGHCLVSPTLVVCR
ncbi:increased DNA methylation 1-like isoform X2 [Asparagus officinalis]|uniref:increased DNA methylation 1-like isoform X2 n=1 Tax=Asparagus officinalis TaxID=4686 RepID=UPI00098E2C31|nr:increased DNA methylation 1-like isoform X2 [Asparagus officinalis]